MTPFPEPVAEIWPVVQKELYVHLRFLRETSEAGYTPIAD